MEIKLINGKDFITAQIKAVSGAVKLAVRGLEKLLNEQMQAAFEAEMQAIQKGESKYINNLDFVEIGIESELARQRGEVYETSSETIKALVSTVKDAITEEFNDKRAIGICKALINTHLLTKKETELIESESESEFWQNQDLDEVQKIVDYFRKPRI